MKNIIITSCQRTIEEYYSRGDVVALRTKKEIKEYFLSYAKGEIPINPINVNLDSLTIEDPSELGKYFVKMCADFGIKLDTFTVFNYHLVSYTRKNKIISDIIYDTSKYRCWKKIQNQAYPQMIPNEIAML